MTGAAGETTGGRTSIVKVFLICAVFAVAG